MATVITKRYRKGERPHGTHVAYVHDKCRCDLCREARRQYTQENRERLRANRLRSDAKHREQISERTRERRMDTRARLDAIKLERGCTDCGYASHSEALAFDHLPGFVKLFDISKCMSRSWDAISDEVAKCEVVCANCHAVRTATRRAESSPR